jgi:hypothetical protein
LTPKIKEELFMTYEIRQNPQFNSLEIYFEGKPSEAVRDVLKSNKFRWHSVKRCWYGYGSEESIAAAITGASTEEEPATVIGDGYMGGGSVYGSKSNHHLHGADLSAAIRADLKKAGIKGVTVRCKTYTGGQSLTATVKIALDEYIPYEQYLENYRITGSQAWIYLSPSEYIHSDKYWAADGDERERIRQAAAAYEWIKLTTQETTPRVSWIDWLTEEAKKKIEHIDAIISAYRYDCSNGMVDYFDTNFYYGICLKPVAA